MSQTLCRPAGALWAPGTSNAGATSWVPFLAALPYGGTTSQREVKWRYPNISEIVRDLPAPLWPAIPRTSLH
jgi:hypothetical protein